MNPTDNRFQPASPRFHQQREDGLYHPIPFAFVSAEMCQAILHERQIVLELLPPAVHEQQHTLFAAYHPQTRFQAFQGLLQRFSGIDAHGPVEARCGRAHPDAALIPLPHDRPAGRSLAPAAASR
jgi:hypothetical protein